MNEERKRILDMLEDGTITADEAMMLLEQLESDGKGPQAPMQAPASAGGRPGERMLRVRGVFYEPSKSKPTNINVNLPLKLAKLAGKIIGALPDSARRRMDAQGINLQDIDWDDIIETLADTGGDIVNVTFDEGDGSGTLRVYVE